MPWYWPFSTKAREKQLIAPVAPRIRMYSGAGFDRTFADWVASSTSADAELRISLRTLRNRSRQLARDNDYVKQALRLIKNNVIGHGVRMQAQVKIGRGPGAGNLASATNQQIEEEWRKWKRQDSCDVSGLRTFDQIERLLVGSVARDGEIFVRLVRERMGRSMVPLALEVIEADLLDDNYNGTAPGGNEIRMGVEVNKWQRPVAYWFFKRHPGDYQYGKDGIAPRVRIPAEEIIHLYLKDERAHQTRGEPWFVSALTRLRHMSGYEEAEVIAARASACQMGFIETPDPDYEVPEDGIMDFERVESFEPGKISTLAPGEKFNSYNPNRPSGLLDPFMRYMLRGAAAGIGVSYESLGKDYSQSNYSSSRLALLDDRDVWRSLQFWVISEFHQRVLEAFMDSAVLSNVLKLSGYELNVDAYTNPRWIPRGWSWVDPQKEIMAYRTAVRSGFMSLTDVVSQNGGDFDELVATRSRELELCESLELVFDTDPELVDQTGAAQDHNPLETPAQEAVEEAAPENEDAAAS